MAPSLLPIGISLMCEGGKRVGYALESSSYSRSGSTSALRGNISSVKVSAHFDSAEFACHDGTVYPAAWLDDATRLPALVAALEVIRRVWDRPVQVLSGYRSTAYNAQLYAARGERPTVSQHCEGRAADIRIAHVTHLELHQRILDLATRRDISIGGLGDYDADHGDFVHVDVRIDPSTGKIRPDHIARWRNYGS